MSSLTSVSAEVLQSDSPIDYSTVLTVPALGRGFSYHVGTSNKSFLKVSRILNENKIKNNAFMLAIIDEELAQYDPRSDNLTEEIKTRILAECVRNPWYYIREVVRIPVTGGSVSFELHLGNLFLLWCMTNNISCFLLLPRQNYKTVSACVFYSWVYNFATTNTHILFFNKELGDSKNNLKRVKEITETLPSWITDDVLNHPLDLNNIEYLQSEDRKNRIDAKPAGKDPVHADKLGRGATVPLKWFDEISFARYISDTFKAAAPAGAKAMVSAQNNNRPYGTCITTTPNMLSDPSGEFAYKIMTESLQFRLEFYDFGPKLVRQMIDEQAEVPFIFAQYTYIELGHDAKWFRTQCRELLNDQLKIKREILLVWPTSGEGSVFTEEQMDQMKQYEKTILSTYMLPTTTTHYIPAGLSITFVTMPDPDKSYLLGVDTASGGGLDFTSFTLVDPDTNETVGNLRCNKSDDEAVRHIAVYIMTALFPKCIAVIERNYLGITIINHLLKDPRTASRLFYLDKEKAGEKIVGGKPTKSGKQKVRVYGIDTTAKSRDVMMRHLLRIMDDEPEILTHPIIQSQITTLQRKKSGKIEHRSGFHDDDLMSFLFCVYANKHEQPVMRKLLGAVKSDSRVKSNINTVSNLNTTEVTVSDMIDHAASQRTVSVDDYVDRTPNKRKLLAGMINSLNEGGNSMDIFNQ